MLRIRQCLELVWCFRRGLDEPPAEPELSQLLALCPLRQGDPSVMIAPRVRASSISYSRLPLPDLPPRHQ